MDRRASALLGGGLAVLALVAASCGSGDETSTQASSAGTPSTATPTSPPLTAVPASADEDAVLTALNLDGTVRWEVEATPELPRVDVPLVAEAAVVGLPSCQGDVAGMWDAASGEQIALGPWGSFDMPLFTSGDFDVVVSAEALTVVDRDSGQERWSTTDASLSLGVPVGDVILFGTDAGIEARSLDSGAVEWIQTSADLRDDAGDQPSYDVRGWDDERVYVGVAWPGSGLSALSLADGSLLWTSPFAPSGEAGSVAAADGLVVGNSLEGGLVEAHDATTGEVVWTAPGSIPWTNTFSSAGLVADGNLYVDGPAALDLASGQVRWNVFESDTWDEDGRPGGPQVIPNLLATIPGGLLVRHYGSDSESIFALDAADGSVVWRQPVVAGTEVAVGADVVVLARSSCYEGD